MKLPTRPQVDRLLQSTLVELKHFGADLQKLALDAKRWYLRNKRISLAVTTGVVAIIAAALWSIFSGLPGRDELRLIGDMSQATTLYDVNNRPVFTIFKEYRIEVPLEKMSINLRKAIVAVEDQRFYDHNGVDPVRIIGAAWADLRDWRAAQGGSTITQQLARQAFLTREKTIWRKVREVVLARRIEAMYGKDEILELYLNKVYFGEGLHGAEAAARGYFGKSASDLSLSEAALLAGLVTAPSVNAPRGNLARATSRRAVVLRAMLDQDIITREAYDRASKEPVELRDDLRREEPLGQYFKEEVRQQLVKQFGWERLSESGLRVYTTIDPEMQRAAESLISQSLEQIEARKAEARKRRKLPPETGPPLQAALVALDPTTGEVRAMVGGRDFADSRFNRAIQAERQPGSAFKPFVYAAALEAGYTPASLIEHLDDPINTLQGAWMPEDEHSSATAMTVRTALRTSSNRAAVRMLENVGIDKTVEYVQRVGVGNVPSVPSLALGSGEVTLMSMTMAYSGFADAGVVHAPVFIRRVEDQSGKVLFEAKPATKEAMSPVTAFLMTSMLSDVVNAGTAYRARAEGFTLPAAGKTGTTNDYVDAWFVGFTPKLSTGVWIGYDQPRTIISGGYAGDLAVPLWAKFMKVATAHDKPEPFTAPEGIVSASVCRVSGMLAASGCEHAIVVDDKGQSSVRSTVYTEYFAKGTVPSEICRVHNSVPEGQLAAAALGRYETPAPLPAPPPPPTTAAAAPEPTPAASVPEQPKKRGFWGRIFGKREKDPKDEKQDRQR